MTEKPSHKTTLTIPPTATVDIQDCITKFGTDRYINREFSLIQFQRRVQEEAMNPNVPLLERVRYLSIVSSNMDEFFMVRIAGLQSMVAQGIKRHSPDGRTPQQQLDLIAGEIQSLYDRQQATWELLVAELGTQDIHIVSQPDLTARDKTFLDDWFMGHIFPALTPLAVDSSHPFPHIANKGTVMVLSLLRNADNYEMKGLLPLPSALPRFIRLPSDTGYRYIAMEDVFPLYLSIIFPGFTADEYGMFRILRDSDLELSDDADDLVATFENLVQQRRWGSVIRLSVLRGMPKKLHTYICGELNVPMEHSSTVQSLNDLATVSQLVGDIDRPDLLFKPFAPRFPKRIEDFGGDCFQAIANKDFVVHHPFESFDVVVRFLEQAGADDSVIAIKQTLYRTGDNSPIVRALINASQAGKSVTAVVELKARFDESANIRWAREMERAGVHVVYGFIQLKTHAKLSMVVRREQGDLRTYCHIGTGNYHLINARVYSDLSLFTCADALGQDVAKVFNFITGYARPEPLNGLAVSPMGIRERLMGHIAQEITNAQNGKPSGIWIKVNNLVDSHMIDALYQASNAGVPVELVVRGICCLRPQVAGLSDTITVKSIVGRFLEHSRVYCFASGHDFKTLGNTLYMGSADLMPRNLNNRVEVIAPILNTTVKQQMLEQIIYANSADNQQSWALKADNTYERFAVDNNGFSAHEFFMNTISLSGQGTEKES